MTSLKIIFVTALIVVCAQAQNAENTAAANTRGNFGRPGRPHRNPNRHNNFGGRPGGFGGQQGGFGGHQGGFGGQQGGFGGHQGFGGRPGGFGQGQVGGFGQGFGQGQGGFGGGAVGGFARPQGSSKCRYYCKTPEGQAYCCETNNQAVSHPVAAIIDKPGRCPPVRDICPLRSSFAPQTCSKHGSCVNADRCCFDRCLGEHVCKAPLY